MKEPINTRHATPKERNIWRLTILSLSLLFAESVLLWLTRVFHLQSVTSVEARTKRTADQTKSTENKVYSDIKNTHTQRKGRQQGTQQFCVLGQWQHQTTPAPKTLHRPHGLIILILKTHSVQNILINRGISTQITDKFLSLLPRKTQYSV